MTYVLRFLPTVEEDALSGYTWYEEKARGLGEEFLRMFYACAREFLTKAYRRLSTALAAREKERSMKALKAMVGITHVTCKTSERADQQGYPESIHNDSG